MFKLKSSEQVLFLMSSSRLPGPLNRRLSAGSCLLGLWASAERLCKTMKITVIFTETLDFLSSDIDVVYIACPNSLAFQFTAVILARKHVTSKSQSVSVQRMAGISRTG